MSLVKIDWKPDAASRRNFGLTMLIGFGAIGLAFYAWPWTWPITQNTPVAWGCWGFAVVSGVLGLSGSRLALAIYLPWMAVAFVMGSIMSRILVATFFYLMITPMGLAMRLIGRDRLQLKRPKGDTCWIDHKTTDDIRRYERQF